MAAASAMPSGVCGLVSAAIVSGLVLSVVGGSVLSAGVAACCKYCWISALLTLVGVGAGISSGCFGSILGSSA